MILRDKLKLALITKAKQKKEPIYCEYIESVSPNVNRQYIDTGIKPNSDTTLVLMISDMAYNGDHGTNQYNVLYSADPRHGNTSRYGLFLSSPERISGQLHYGDDFKQLSATPPITGKHIFKQVNNELYIDNDLVCVAPAQTFQCNNSLVIFGDTQYANWTPILAKLYSVQMYDKDNTLLVNLRPCLHPDTLEPCMYDTVKGEYHYNKGREPFKYKLGFTKLDYLESIGGQFIDTGVEDGFDIDWNIGLSFPIIKENYLMGNNNGSNLGAYGTQIGGSGVRLPLATKVGEKYDYKFSRRTTGRAMTVNGVSGQGSAGGSEKGNIFLFGYGGISASGNATTLPFIIYYSQIFKGGILLSDLIPVRMNDGTLGMWNFVNGEVLPNNGTGKFKGYLNGYQVGENLESDRKQVIPTKIIPDDTTVAELYFKDAIKSTGLNGIFGCYDVPMASRFQLLTTDVENQYSVGYSDGADRITIGDDTGINHFIMDAINHKANLNNQSVTLSNVPLKITTDMWLFATNQVSGVIQCAVKIISFQTSKNGKPIFNVIPVQKDGFIGMLDTLTGKEYPNMGSGSFIFNP